MLTHIELDNFLFKMDYVFYFEIDKNLHYFQFRDMLNFPIQLS